MKSFHKLDKVFNVDEIIESLEANDDLWNEYPHRKTGAHSEMTDVWVRFGDISKGCESFTGEHDSVWYPSAEKIKGIKALCRNLMRDVDGERLGGVLITKLPAGSQIYPHIDKGWHAGYYEKFYIALKSPKGSMFCFEDGNIESNQGDCYLFRNNIKHWVINDSDSERWSLIVCIKTDKFKEI